MSNGDAVRTTRVVRAVALLSLMVLNACGGAGATRGAGVPRAFITGTPSMATHVPSPPVKPPVRKGSVYGTVLLRGGNCMPTIESDEPSSCGEVLHERRRVFVYAPPLRWSDFDGADYEGPRRPHRVTTTARDRYSIPLAPGEYSVLIESYSGRPAMGSPCSSGSYCGWVRVLPGRSARVDLELFEGAY